MSNVRGLYDDRLSDSDDGERDSNNRYVGGIGAQGGGSGLAVEPNADDSAALAAPSSDSIFNLAEAAGSAGAEEEEETLRRTITMYRDGFVVDDGPYRRLDDPQNADFLRSLARGQTPSELLSESQGGNITVGLVDKRKEDYVETFRSFSGAGQSLGAAASPAGSPAADGVLDPSALPAVSEDGANTTSIAVRMLDGKRKVIKIALSCTVEQLAARAVLASNTTIDVPFRMVTGFPPKPLLLLQQTIEEAGLKGAQVQLQKA